jgi:hypothetical protein
MKALVCASLFSLLATPMAKSQTWEVSAFAAYPRIASKPLGSLNDTANAQDTDTTLKGQRGYGGRLTYNTRGYYGHELEYQQNQAWFRTLIRTTEGRVTVTTRKEDRIKIRQLSYNFLIYFMPKGERWRPFMTGGAQGAIYQAPRIPEFTFGSYRTYGANYGAGLKVKLFEHALVRIDFRHHIGGKPYDLTFAEFGSGGGFFGTMTGSAGISIGF